MDRRATTCPTWSPSTAGSSKPCLMCAMRLLVLVIAGTVAAAVVVGAAGASILRPLAALTSSAREIESGNLDLILPVRSRDEIGVLSEAFNAMAAQLREFRRIDHDRLVRTQQTTQLAIDSLPDAVFIIGPDAKIEISNRTAREHFGIEPGLTVSVSPQRSNGFPRFTNPCRKAAISPKPPAISPQSSSSITAPNASSFPAPSP